MTPVPVTASFVIAGLVVAVARRLRWLTWDGALAAWIVGGVVLAAGGLQWAVVLVTFFATGSLLTRVGRDRKTQPEHTSGGRRAAQVLCTGGIGGAIALAWGTWPLSEPLRALLYPAFLGSLAAATADTWATEVGMLSSAVPRLVTTWRPVALGTSGGVTALGTLAGAAGAGLVAALGAVGVGAPVAGTLMAVTTAAGVVAMLLDSVLGATLQAVYRRPDGTVTERIEGPALRAGGLRWMTNEVVNLIATTAGALVAGALAFWR